jgi:hypothetical protein
MELTKKQKALGLPDSWWEYIERTKKSVEYFQKHPLTSEQIKEQIRNSKHALQNQASLNKQK